MQIDSDNLFSQMFMPDRVPWDEIYFELKEAVGAQKNDLPMKMDICYKCSRLKANENGNRLNRKQAEPGRLTGGDLALAWPTNCLTWRIFGDSLYGVVGM
jgi:hypothetical protein